MTICFLIGVTTHWISLIVQKINGKTCYIYLDSENLDQQAMAQYDIDKLIINFVIQNDIVNLMQNQEKQLELINPNLKKKFIEFILANVSALNKILPENKIQDLDLLLDEEKIKIIPEFKKLIEEKDDLEKEIAQIDEKLKPFIEKGLSKPITDSEGFPNPDLDFFELKEFRELKKKKNGIINYYIIIMNFTIIQLFFKIKELNNDHKDLMKKVEKELYAFHEQQRKNGQAEQEIQELKNKNPQKMEEEVKQDESDNVESQKIEKNLDNLDINQEKIYLPYAKITEVKEASPAHKAGIQVDDLIVDFGGVVYNNHNNLQNLVSKVQQNLNKAIAIQLLRQADENQQQDQNIQKVTWNNQSNYIVRQLNLVPSKWDGQGILGCRFKDL
ncbi:PDZ domain [Pseudocohnilembus persalinus]|uniref:PDZ domain n=1 Tax=Pseudocohnilembus persalinus TaxID=266149 RepID=A0A0V0R7E7_PSEPJ|nr:PDZ domain [Pseudocohnilembus persalinus]|eukprot:KRX10402.1 PDZ domain [Pseudocohnilembus persalinus]